MWKTTTTTTTTYNNNNNNNNNNNTDNDNNNNNNNKNNNNKKNIKRLVKRFKLESTRKSKFSHLALVQPEKKVTPQGENNKERELNDSRYFKIEKWEQCTPWGLNKDFSSKSEEDQSIQWPKRGEYSYQNE